MGDAQDTSVQIPEVPCPDTVRAVGKHEPLHHGSNNGIRKDARKLIGSEAALLDHRPLQDGTAALLLGTQILHLTLETHDIGIPGNGPGHAPQEALALAHRK